MSSLPRGRSLWHPVRHERRTRILLSCTTRTDGVSPDRFDNLGHLPCNDSGKRPSNHSLWCRCSSDHSISIGPRCEPSFRTVTTATVGTCALAEREPTLAKPVVMRGGPPGAPLRGNRGCDTLGFCQVWTYLQPGKWANKSAGNGSRGWTGLRVMSLNMSNAVPGTWSQINLLQQLVLQRTTPRFGQASPLEMLVAQRLSALSWAICPPSIIAQSFANSSAFSFPLMTNCSKCDISRFLFQGTTRFDMLDIKRDFSNFFRNLYLQSASFEFGSLHFISLLESQSMTTCSVVGPHILLTRQRKVVSSVFLMVCCISFLSSIVS